MYIHKHAWPLLISLKLRSFRFKPSTTTAWALNGRLNVCRWVYPSSTSDPSARLNGQGRTRGRKYKEWLNAGDGYGDANMYNTPHAHVHARRHCTTPTCVQQRHIPHSFCCLQSVADSHLYNPYSLSFASSTLLQAER